MRKPERYAVIGHPIAHSLSPRIHALFAQQTHQNLHYGALDVLPAQLSECVNEFFATGGRGMNVTVPHKRSVTALLARLSARAQRAGAVNTIIADEAGLSGDNTDGVGLVRDLVQNLRLGLRAQRVLLLGAGGAARGVLGPLLELEPSEIVIVNRTPDRSLVLAQEWAVTSPVRSAALGELASSKPFALIVNATAASPEAPPLPPAVLGASTVCYDLAYGPHASAFLEWARRQGATQTHTGLGMLVEQAAESFALWRGVRPDTAPVLAALRAEQRALAAC